MQRINIQRLRLLGHVIRMEEDDPASNLWLPENGMTLSVLEALRSGDEK